MKRIPPQVAAIHDLSCFGRCALTVIIPTLSALGIQTVPLPTALLSTHTGGFENMFFYDLSSEMNKISEHFAELELKFDAIYSGFLGSEAQIKQVSDFIDRFSKPNTLILVDPVMGDDGVLYSTYTKALGKGMQQLVQKADVITPNYTEACFLTETPYIPTQSMKYDEIAELAQTLIRKLSKFGNKQIVMTGLETADSIITCGVTEKGMFIDERERHAASYPGTGDIFASTLLGYLINGDDLETATHKACKFTARVIEYTMKFPTPHRNGVMLEPCLKFLFRE